MPAEDEDVDQEPAGTEEYLCAKMHLVDLAGSERLDRTQVGSFRVLLGTRLVSMVQGVQSRLWTWLAASAWTGPR